MKLLLTKDYNDIVKETFTLPKRDIEKYYTNIINEHIGDNPDIYQELKQAVTRWLDWYRKQAGKDVVYATKKEQGEQEKTMYTEAEKAAWEAKHREDRITDIYIPVSVGGITRNVNKAFFTRQLFLLNFIERSGMRGNKTHKKTSTIEEREITLTHLKIFTGKNVQKEEIMTDENYKRLEKYSLYLVSTGKVPDNIKPISQINLSTVFIRYTFYLLHKELYTTTHIKEEWITFLHEVFRQFGTEEWKTTKTKFSLSPSSYKADKKIMLKN